MDNLTPTFDLDSLSFADIQTDAEQITASLQKQERKDKNLFPVEVFPLSVQEIIRATNETLSFPIDFTGAAILYAVSLAIANTHRVEVKRGWNESPLLYLAIVGRAGTNKSHPLSFALNPFFEKDKKTFKEYEQKRQEYQYVANLSKKDREQQCIAEPVKPVWQKHIVQDFTPEALTEVHKHNKRGIGVYADELASWFKNFNRYNKGSEQEFWLSNWSGKPVIIDRKSGEPTFIPLPFIPVIGTIQNAILEELAKDSRNQNGFIDRILFAMPNDLTKPYWSETELQPSIIENWEYLLSKLIELPLSYDETESPVPAILKFTGEAKQALKQWQVSNTDQCNHTANEAHRGIYSKLELYVVRLSLILEMMQWAAGEGEKKAVGIEAVNGAIQLIEYFKNTALQVNSIVSNHSPLDKLPADKQSLYEALPDTFTTDLGLEIAKRLGFAERTFKRFLNDRELLEKVSRGEYEKKF